MAMLTVNQAARAGYAGRATIYRKLRAGELPAQSGDNDQAIIDSADLERVFGEPRSHRETSHESIRDIAETAQLRAENSLLRAENADLRLQRDRLMSLLEQASVPAPRTGLTLRRLLGRRARARARTQDPQ